VGGTPHPHPPPHPAHNHAHHAARTTTFRLIEQLRPHRSLAHEIALLQERIHSCEFCLHLAFNAVLAAAEQDTVISDGTWSGFADQRHKMVTNGSRWFAPADVITSGLNVSGGMHGHPEDKEGDRLEERTRCVSTTKVTHREAYEH
jgi:hypothetical protein